MEVAEKFHNDLLEMTEEEFVSKNIGLVFMFADEYFKSKQVRAKCQFEDLVQEGNIALIKAYRGYSDIKFKPSTYTSRIIKNEIYRYLNFKVNMIHINPWTKKKYGVTAESVSFETELSNVGEGLKIYDIIGFLLDDSKTNVDLFIKCLTENEAELLQYLLMGYTVSESEKFFPVSRQMLHKRLELIRDKYLFFIESNRAKKTGEKLVLTRKSLSLIKPDYREVYAARLAPFKRKGIPQERSLTDKQVREIRVRMAKGELGTELAKEYKVSPTLIYQVKNMKKYQDVV